MKTQLHANFRYPSPASNRQMAVKLPQIQSSPILRQIRLRTEQITELLKLDQFWRTIRSSQIWFFHQRNLLSLAIISARWRSLTIIRVILTMMQFKQIRVLKFTMQSILLSTPLCLSMRLATIGQNILKATIKMRFLILNVFQKRIHRRFIPIKRTALIVWNLNSLKSR